MRIDRWLRIRYFALAVFFLIILAGLSWGEASTPPSPSPSLEEPGTDLFLAAPTALLHAPDPRANAAGRLRTGARLRLLSVPGAFLRVELAEDPGRAFLGRSAAASGYVAADSVLRFGRGPEATTEMLAVGRGLSRSSATRRLAAALLRRAIERRRTEGGADPTAELLLAEAEEKIGDQPGGPVAIRYEDVFAHASGAGSSLRPVQERAAAGIVRRTYPRPGETLLALWNETDAWLAIADSAADPEALRDSGWRLGNAALRLARLLLAARRKNDLETLEKRVRRASVRLRAELPGSTTGDELDSDARLIAAMRGDGGDPFPRDVAVAGPAGERRIRIEGEIGNLTLVLIEGGSRKVGAAVPILPVPGSLTISVNGLSAAWLEVLAPGVVSPVVVDLARLGTAAEPVMLSGGRPGRDRRRGRFLGAIAGFSRDGRRLAISAVAWEETAPKRGRLAVVAASDGRLIFDASDTARNRRRLRRFLR